MGFWSGIKPHEVKALVSHFKMARSAPSAPRKATGGGRMKSRAGIHASMGIKLRQTFGGFGFANAGERTVHVAGKYAGAVFRTKRPGGIKYLATREHPHNEFVNVTRHKSLRGAVHSLLPHGAKAGLARHAKTTSFLGKLKTGRSGGTSMGHSHGHTKGARHSFGHAHGGTIKVKAHVQRTKGGHTVRVKAHSRRGRKGY